MEPGDRVGRYELVRELGRGGMGEVWVARDPAAGREVALKLVTGTDALRRARFGVEAEALARLRHPRIVTIHEVGEAEGTPFMVMDLIEGRGLDRVLEEDGPLGPELAAQAGADVAEALAHAHARGVLHRDVKPGNILLAEDGRARLTDFGLAKVAVDPQSLTEPGQVVGTLFYMGPEQLQGKPADERTDVYALGVTLYEALTGRPPFLAQTPASLIGQVLTAAPEPPSARRPDLPRDLDAVVLRCLAKAPRDRYASAADLQADLRRFLDGEPVRARGVRVSRALLWGLGVLAGAALGGLLLGLGWSLLVRPRQEARAAVEQVRAWEAAHVTPWGSGLLEAPAPDLEEVAAHGRTLARAAATLGDDAVDPALRARVAQAERALRLAAGEEGDPPRAPEEVGTAAEAVVDAQVLARRGEAGAVAARLAHAEALLPGDPPARVLALRRAAAHDPAAFFRFAAATSGAAGRAEARRRFGAALATWVARLAASEPRAASLDGVEAARRALGLELAAVRAAKARAFAASAPAWGARLRAAAARDASPAALRALSGLLRAPPAVPCGPELRAEVERLEDDLLERFRGQLQTAAGRRSFAQLVRLDEVAYYALGWRGPRSARLCQTIEMARAIDAVHREVGRGRLLLITFRAGLPIWGLNATNPLRLEELEPDARRWPGSQALAFARYLVRQREERLSVGVRLSALRRALLEPLPDLAPIYRGELWREIAQALHVQSQLEVKRRTPAHGLRVLEAAQAAERDLRAGDRRLLETFGYTRRNRWLLEAYRQQTDAGKLLGYGGEWRVALWRRAVAVWDERLPLAQLAGRDDSLVRVYRAFARYHLARSLLWNKDMAWRMVAEQARKELLALEDAPEPAVRPLRQDLLQQLKAMFRSQGGR